MSTAITPLREVTESLDIVLLKDPYPLCQDIADWKRIRKDSCFCYVCCNLFTGTASSLIPRRDIFMHENSGGKDSSITLRPSRRWMNLRTKPNSADDSAEPAWKFMANSVDMRERADDGCASCWILLNGIIKLNDSSPPSLKFDALDFVIAVTFWKGCVLRVDVGLLEEAEMDPLFGEIDLPEMNEKPVMFCEFYTLPDPCPWPTIGSSMDFMEPYSGSEAWRGGLTCHVKAKPNEETYLDIIRHWITHCEKEHPICHQELADNNFGPLPKRVIDLGSDKNSCVRVLECNNDEIPIKKPYIALSHCWGRTEHVVSKKENINRWKKELPLHDLSRTFREAIAMTRMLGIQYLWIDSLCIIQDDNSDWEAEAAKMGLIYHRAYLVIAATGSADGDGGIFIDRSPFVTLNGKDKDGKGFQVFVRHRSLRHECFGWGAHRFDRSSTTRFTSGQITYKDYPLFNRAWCFQERLLGPRILHFTRDELILECISSVSCECRALADSQNDELLECRNFLSSNFSGDSCVDQEEREEFLGKLPQLAIEHALITKFSILDEWYNMVAEYSERRITRFSDWLPAISGLASRWKSQGTGEYLAGLWSKDLLHGLMWVSYGHDVHKEAQYVAPSWSWASTLQPVRWLREGDRTIYFVQISLQKTACVPKGANKLGEVACGWLFITGPVVEGILVFKSSWEVASVKSNGVTEDFVIDSKTRCSELDGRTVFCLKYCTDIGIKGSSQFHRVLILARVEEGDQKTLGLPIEIQNCGHIYQRIGVQGYCMLDKWDFERKCTTRSMYVI